MSITVVVGGQWGDEGKGRIIDLMAQKAHIIARYSAGSNAGHTVINELGEFALHLIPAGIFHFDKLCIIGNGVVIDPPVLLEELAELESRGVSVGGRLFISDRSHVLMPWHRIIDAQDEKLRGKGAIGTTGRGVGPAFVDKVGRAGVRIADLVDRESLRSLLSFLVPYKNQVLERLYGAAPLSLDAVLDEYSEYGRRFAPLVTDTGLLVSNAVKAGKNVLMEGAQGSLLDLDAGTYEYVTSSVPSSLAAGAAVGVGIGPTQIDEVIGVYKAYTTRVGNGPMPTELHDETAALLREGGPRPEYGATTGRPRRCGWFDGVAARYSARINGLTSAVLTRLDVLDQFPVIKVCTAYKVGSRITENMPAAGADLARAEPVYEEIEGWQQPTANARRADDLPPAARRYIAYIQDLLGTKITLVSVGPERDQAITLRS